MKYSFILIAYNEEENILSCINSILAQDKLSDSYEVIVVDDGSHDKTGKLVNELAKKNSKVKLISDGKNHGRGYGRYTGVKSSTGEYIIMVDADIVLPKTWLATCLKHIKKYDVVGGIAVPDGDVAYVYRKFNLKPKTVMGSTTITGNNGMYKRKVFSKVNFDKNLREGEDVDFNHRATAAGFSTYCIPGISVEHQESKSLLRSMHWLYQSGIGATRQLVRFHKVRLPDIAFAVTLLAALTAGALTLTTRTGLWLMVPLVSLLSASFMHMQSKFNSLFSRPLRGLGALATDTLLIFCYYIGRAAGPIFYLFDRSSAELADSQPSSTTIIVIPTLPQLRYRPFIFAERLAIQGHNVHYIVWDDPFHMGRKDLLRHFFTSLLPLQYQRDRITVHKFARLPYYWPYINGLLFKHQLKKLYKNVNADLVFTETFTNETEVPKSLPFIYDLADDYAAPAELYGSRFYKMAFKLLDVKGVMRRQCQNAMAITAVSDSLISLAKPYNKVTYKIPNGIEKSAALKALRRHRQPINPYSFIYVSVFAQWSRPISAMQAVIELRDEFPSITLTLVGPGISNAESESIKKYISDNNASKFIHYLGPVFDREKVFDLIGENAIGLNISIKDKLRDAAQPVKVVEYSVMGKKIVSTDLAEVKALNFRNVFFFSDSHEQNLKKAMREALLHKEEANGYADVSAYTLKNRSWDVLTDKLLLFVKSLGD